jgi:CHAD domain-containing protein
MFPEARPSTLKTQLALEGMVSGIGNKRKFRNRFDSAENRKPMLENNGIREFARDTALHFIGALFDNADGAKTTEDIEVLHDMRVASRRLRETFKLFGLFYPAKKLKKASSKVKKITRLLGMPREMDVNVSLLQAYKTKISPPVQATHEYLLEIFEFEQTSLRGKMLKAFDKIDLKALESELVMFSQTALQKSKPPHLLVGSHPDLEADAFFKQTPALMYEKATPLLSFQSSSVTPPNDGKLHRLRIELKKFRYVLEICDPLHEGRFKKAIGLAKELQEILGKIHDNCVLVEHLNAQRNYLFGKNRPRLAKGCQKIIQDFETMKQSFYPLVGPACAAFLDEICRQIPPKVTPMLTGQQGQAAG